MSDLRLVPLRVDHVDHVMTWVNDPEVTQYFANLQAAVTPEQERAYLERLVASPTDRAYSLFDGDDYVGQCSVNQIYWPARNGRLFLVVRADRQGRGYGRAALDRLVEVGFTELDLHKLWLIVRRENHRAQSLYASVGFDFEGVLRDEYRVGGRFFDMVRMARLRPPRVGSGPPEDPC